MYPVPCSCGQQREVPSTEAGRTYQCTCGLTVEIPTLRELKQSVGESSTVVELEIEYKLNQKLLPESSICEICQIPTEESATAIVVCESITQKSESKLSSLATFLLFRWVGLILKPDFAGGRERDVGRHVQFPLPIRICSACRDQNRGKAKTILKNIPLYARLLQKYPHAEVSKLQ